MGAAQRRDPAVEKADGEAAGVALTRKWVIEKLMANAERAMQGEPVLDKWGVPTGVYRYEGGVANKALELLGKGLGMFKNTKPPEQPPKPDSPQQMLEQMSEVERVRRVATMIRRAEREHNVTILHRDPNGVAAPWLDWDLLRRTCQFPGSKRDSHDGEVDEKL
jgi:hypothetical protein